LKSFCTKAGCQVSGVEGGFYGESAALQYMSVDHGGFDVLMPEEFLDGADVVSVLEEVGGEGVSECVRGDVFVNFGGFGGGTDGFLQQAGVEVVAHGLFGGGVHREGGGGEEVLPCGFAGGVGVFAGEGVGEVDFAEAVSEVGLVDALDGLDLALESGDEGVGEDGGAVVFALAIADDDGVAAEVYVFDAQSKAFHEAQPGAVEDLCHKLGNTAHFRDDCEGFLMGDDDGQGFGFLGADDVGGEFDLDFEDVAVEEEDGAEGLVLGGGGDVPFGCKVGDECLDFGGAHVLWVAFAVEEDVAFDPVFVGLFGAEGVVFGADGVGDEFQEFAGRVLFHGVDLFSGGMYNLLIGF
jgi:hypothetical protein